MNKQNLIASLLSLGMLSTVPAMAQDQVVKLTTAKAMGEAITLRTNQMRKSVTVDWGNGTTQTYAPTDGQWLTIEGTVQGSEITLTASKQLTTLIANDNQLTAIDLSGATRLRSLFCRNNKLTDLDVTGLASLTDLDCANNSVEKLKISASKNPLLENVNLSGNGMKSAAGTSSTKFEVAQENIQQVNIANNAFSSVYLNKNIQLDAFICSNNALSAKVNLSQNDSLTTLMADGNQIQSLTLPTTGGLPCLQQAVIDGNKLATLDLESSTLLTTLYCTNNQLTQVALPAKTKLYAFACDNNKLTFSSLPTSRYMPTHISYANQDENVDITAKLKKKSGYYYIPQCPSWSDRLNESYLLDLSDWAVDTDGQRTITLTWFGNQKGKEPAALTKASASRTDGDYFPLTSSSNYGKFSFLQPHDEVFCTMTSNAYPELTFKSTVFTVGDPTSGIATTTVSSPNDLTLTASSGRLTISAAAPTTVRIYSAAGRLVWQGNANGNETIVTLPAGVYIVNGQKVML